jgi:hypothetical protein
MPALRCGSSSVPGTGTRPGGSSGSGYELSPLASSYLSQTVNMYFGQLAEAQHEVGLEGITEEALQQMRVSKAPSMN